jgi:hypothetical protein
MEKKVTEKSDESPVALHREDTKNDVEKPGAVKRDYSGAVVEIDPVERKLVRKLDIRIMVCFLDPSNILYADSLLANIMDYVLAQLS